MRASVAMSKWVLDQVGVFMLCCSLVSGSALADEPVSARHQEQSIHFSEHLLADGFGYVYGVAAADLDRDGDPDLTAADIQEKTHSTLFWYQNDGAGAFERHVIHPNEPGWLERRAIGDLNHDGALDIAIVNNLKGHVLWFENPGASPTGPWRRHVITTNCPTAYNLVLVNLDHDGNLDVATSGWLSNLIAWYEHPGTENLQREWTRRVIDDQMDEARTICSGDFDRDGRIDLLVSATGKAGYSPGEVETADHRSQVVWYQNPGQPARQSWTKHIIDNRLPVAVHGHPVDLDFDGDLDVVMAYGMRVDADPQVDRHRVVWYENIAGANGLPVWKRHHVGWLPYAYESVPGDLDRDGDLDMVVSAWSRGDRILWFENAGAGRWLRHVVRKDLACSESGNSC